MPDTPIDGDFGRPPRPLLCHEDELDAISIDNGFEIAALTDDLAIAWGGKRQFTPELILEYNRIAMQGIYACAGHFRTEPVTAGSFAPPAWQEVPRLVAEMCHEINSHPAQGIEVAAFTLWRVNWIHPFFDGNGRCARELTQLVLKNDIGIDELRNFHDVSTVIQNHRVRYFEALQHADQRWSEAHQPDVRQLESLLFEIYL